MLVARYILCAPCKNFYFVNVFSIVVFCALQIYPVVHLQVTTMYHLDRPMYLLGYLANQSRVYLIDKEFKCVFLIILPAYCLVLNS